MLITSQKSSYRHLPVVFTLMRSKLLFTLLLMLAAPTARAEPIEPADVTVVDGDTIAVYHMHPNVRLVGFNAPETSNVCEAERQLGLRAAQRLFELVRAGHLDFVYVECSCPAGTQGKFSCNYGRDCGTLKSNGRDVGSILIAEGPAAWPCQASFIAACTMCRRKPSYPRIRV